MEKPSIGKTAVLLGGVALGGWLIFGGGGTANAAPSDPCAAIRDQANKLIASATKADIATMVDLANKAKAAGCTDVANALQKKIDSLGTVFSPPPPPSTIPFNPAKAKDPVRAHSLAIAIGNSPVPPGAPSNGTDVPSRANIRVALDGTYKDFVDFCNDIPRNGGGSTIVALQDASGISTDGKCGTQTTAAWNYWLTHSTRPDGSVNVAGEGGSMDTTAWGNQVIAAIAGETNIQNLGTLMRQARALGLPHVEEAVAARIAGCCASCDRGDECIDQTVGVYGEWGFPSVWGSRGEFGANVPKPFKRSNAPYHHFERPLLDVAPPYGDTLFNGSVGASVGATSFGRPLFSAATIQPPKRLSSHLPQIPGFRPTEWNQSIPCPDLTVTTDASGRLTSDWSPNGVNTLGDQMYHNLKTGQWIARSTDGNCYQAPSWFV